MPGDKCHSVSCNARASGALRFLVRFGPGSVQRSRYRVLAGGSNRNNREEGLGAFPTESQTVFIGIFRRSLLNAPLMFDQPTRWSTRCLRGFALLDCNYHSRVARAFWKARFSDYDKQSYQSPHEWVLEPQTGVSIHVFHENSYSFQ